MTLVNRAPTAAAAVSSSGNENAGILLRVGYTIRLDFREATPAVLMLYLHPEREPSINVPGGLRVEPRTRVSEYLDLYGNRCGSLLAPRGLVTFRDETIVGDSGAPDPQSWDAAQHPVEDLPDDVLLNAPSREGSHGARSRCRRRGADDDVRAQPARGIHGTGRRHLVAARRNRVFEVA